MSQGDAQSFALADGIIRKSFVLASFQPFIVDKVSRPYFCVDVGTLLAEEIKVIAFNEADLHAFSFLGFRFKSLFFQIITDFLFGISA